MSLTFHPITVSSIQRETEDAISLGFDIPESLRPEFAYRPGQYLTLRAMIGGQDIRRAYSICSSPDDATIRVAIKRVEGGSFSTWAHEALAPGVTLGVMRPEGRFTLPPPPGSARTLLAIAAGSGITPILSIMKTVLSREPDSRFVLLYGSRSTANILFRPELEAAKDRFIGRLSVIHVLSREQQDIPVLNGRIDAGKLAALLPGLFPGPLPDTALLCGPGLMIDAMSAALMGAGLPPGRILSERFSTSEPRAPARPIPAAAAAVAPASATATIIADGIATPIPVQQDETLLDAALRAGLDLPFSCRAGMCSTCRARVIKGAVAMDVNYGLEPWETASGYVLTCQARPTTATLTIDYDHV